MSLVVPFLQQQVFFVTGATGFVGKVLLAKLLTVCPTLPEHAIYVLVRGRQSVRAEERFVQEVLKGSLMFAPLLQARGLDALMRTIKVVDGDVALPRLGLSDAHYAEVSARVTCVIHVAATVNFNERLRLAVDINVLGARRILELAKSCRNLRACVHTSTCYVNCIRRGREEISERIYPVSHSVAALVEQLCAMTAEEADAATPTIIAPHPNTYTYTKFLAEHVLHDERGSVPLAIVRPSIIGGALEFPVPGWVDSYIGPAGLVVASALGALHCMVGDAHAICDMIPVDLVVNTLLTVAVKTGSLETVDTLNVYQCASGTVNPMKWDMFRQTSNGYYWRQPLQKRIMPNYAAAFSRYGVRFFLLQSVLSSIPAAISDAKLMLQGEKPRNWNQIRSLDRIVKSLRFFTSHPWKFSTQQTRALVDELPPDERRMFPIDARHVHWELYLTHFYEGIRYYLLKEPRPANHTFHLYSKL